MLSKQLRNALALCILAFGLSSQAADEIRFISDKMYVPLRASQGDDAEIVNNGLVSGTALKLLQEDKTSGYSLVELRNGTQGWIRSRYLVKEPTAALKLADMEKKFSESGPKNDAELMHELDALKEKNKKLVEQNADSQRQLDEIKQASSNVVKITQQNREMIEKIQVLQSKIDSLEAIKEKYKEDNNMALFMYGGLLVIITLIFSSLLDYFKRRRSYSSWG